MVSLQCNTILKDCKKTRYMASGQGNHLLVESPVGSVRYLRQVVTARNSEVN